MFSRMKSKEPPAAELKSQFPASEEFLSAEADDVKRKRSTNSCHIRSAESLTQVAVCGGCKDDVPPPRGNIALRCWFLDHTAEDWEVGLGGGVLWNPWISLFSIDVARGTMALVVLSGKRREIFPPASCEIPLITVFLVFPSYAA